MAPIFSRPKSQRYFKPAESPTETLATQATVNLSGLQGHITKINYFIGE